MKRNTTFLLISVLILLGLPLLTVTFASHDAGMMICFLLFFAIDPIYSILVGIFAGRDVKQCWFQPFLVSALFLAGTWLFFDEGETAFLGYAGIYLLLGLAAMGAVFLIKKLRK